MFERPAASPLALVDTPDTRTGDAAFSRELKSVPPLYLPQHQRELSACTAQLKSEPCPATAAAPTMPCTCTGSGPPESVTPVPSWPRSLAPQHQTDPALVSAQVWALPQAMATAPFAP